MTDATHECPGPDCYRRVGRNQLACPKHWARVHPDTKRAVYAAYRSGDVTAHRRAMSDAIEDMQPRTGRTSR